MNRTPGAAYDLKLDWCPSPHSDHIVQFYQSDDELLGPLAKYIDVGLKHGDVCVVIATPGHMKRLDELLVIAGIPLAKARQNGHYIAYDAVATMAKFMVNGLPNEQRFRAVMRHVLSPAEKNSQAVRAFGEMVALLWKKGNAAGVARLEQLWDNLGQHHAFSLYCAYPQKYFDRRVQGHNAMLDKISQFHLLVTPDFARV